MNEQLNFVRTLTKGRVLARNRWATGYQDLVYASREAFERAKAEVEGKNVPPKVTGFTPCQ